MIHKLRTPFEKLDKSICKEVNARDYLTGGDILAGRRRSSDPVEQGYQMIAEICGLQLSEVESMDVQDLAVLDTHIAGLFGKKE